MANQQKIRFASGGPDALFSGIWRIVVNKDDVYIGGSKSAMGIYKVSLHKSGVWVLAGTEQSGATFNGNRRGKQWKRPLEHSLGITRGPSILIPRTSLGSRPFPPDEVAKDVVWFKEPGPGQVVDFSMYFVEKDARTEWDTGQMALTEFNLARGNRLILFGSVRQAPAPFLATVEDMLERNVFHVSDPDAFAGGSLLWYTEAPDLQNTIRFPVIVDLPVSMKGGPPASQRR